MTFRVTAEELYRLTVKAVKSGKSLSEFARTKVIAARSRRPARAADDAGSLVAIDHALFDELRRQGVNLNQIARHCNTQQVPPPPSLEPLLREIRDLLDRGMAGRDP